MDRTYKEEDPLVGGGGSAWPVTDVDSMNFDKSKVIYQKSHQLRLEVQTQPSQPVWKNPSDACLHNPVILTNAYFHPREGVLSVLHLNTSITSRKSILQVENRLSTGHILGDNMH